jgi:hypothetical protein
VWLAEGALTVCRPSFPVAGWIDWVGLDQQGGTRVSGQVEDGRGFRGRASLKAVSANFLLGDQQDTIRKQYAVDHY